MYTAAEAVEVHIDAGLFYTLPYNGRMKSIREKYVLETLAIFQNLCIR
jgi:hypothetical protein